MLRFYQIDYSLQKKYQTAFNAKSARIFQAPVKHPEETDEIRENERASCSSGPQISNASFSPGETRRSRGGR